MSTSTSAKFFLAVLVGAGVGVALGAATGSVTHRIGVGAGVAVLYGVGRSMRDAAKRDRRGGR
jgi:hypothetical protein